VALLKLRNNLDDLPALERWVREFAEQHGMAERDQYAVNLVLEELFANVIAHGHDDRDEHEIVIRMKIVGRDLHIEFEDDGREFNPVDAPAPDLDVPLAERPVGGLGIHLVKSFVDSIDHLRSNGRNKLALVKKEVVAAGASGPGPCPSRDAG
jgi:anti-sigma regulatory factor (Ser/Thr protein kinase)